MSTATLRSAAELRAIAERAAVDLADASAQEILAWAAGEFGQGFAVAGSMQDNVLVHLASTVIPGVDVLFLDTGYHFVETIGTRGPVPLAGRSSSRDAPDG